MSKNINKTNGVCTSLFSIKQGKGKLLNLISLEIFASEFYDLMVCEDGFGVPAGKNGEIDPFDFTPGI